MARATTADGAYNLDVELDRTAHPDGIIFVRIARGHQRWSLTLRLRPGVWSAQAVAASDSSVDDSNIAFIDAYSLGWGVQPLTRELHG